ncbi:WD40 repeat domain-containing protein [Micromonosporaceae bacterium Da 78-11]
MAIDSAGTSVAMADHHGNCWFWRPESSAEVTAVDISGARIQAMQFAPEGNTLVLGGKDGSIWIWAAGETRRLAVGSPSGISAVEWLDAGTVVVGAADGSVRTYDVESGLLRAEIDATASGAGFGRSIRALAVDRPSSRIAVGSHLGRVLLWQPKDTGPVLQLQDRGPRIGAVSFRNDGALLAGGNRDGVVRVRSGDSSDGLEIKAHVEAVHPGRSAAPRRRSRSSPACRSTG